VSISYSMRVELAVNRSMVDDFDTIVEKGAIVGMLNGQTITALARLRIYAGMLFAHATFKRAMPAA
jgi:hypothetical protein